MWQLFALVASLTALSFGGGQLLLAGLERELVQTGQLDPQAFAVAVTLGQSTPGPLAAFTTAVGMAVQGVPGGIAATGALIAVSLAAVALIARIPKAWLKLPQVKAGLQGVAPLATALALYLALRALTAIPPTATSLAMIAAIAAARLARAPTYAVVLGAISAGMVLHY